MISNKMRENRKGKPVKMPKNIERLYKEGKCSECSVVVTRMDFAKILGKFTKVKIQYESSSTPKTRKNNQLTTSPNARLKKNENGMVMIPRNAYNQHPVSELLKKSKQNEKPTSRTNSAVKDKSKLSDTSSPHVNNILKENNRLKKTPTVKDKQSNYFGKNVVKRYGIIFLNPSENNNKEKNKNNFSLLDLLPSIDDSILPSEDWSIDYLPKNGEPKEDKVYDRIAAELEDLMCNEKPVCKVDSKAEPVDNKDEFPSIMDILNDNSSETTQSNNQSNQITSPNLESSDVEAMLLGKVSEASKDPETTPMEVDNAVISNLMDVVQMNSEEDPGKLQTDVKFADNPHSPSILDEALQKGIEEHLPKETISQESTTGVEISLTNMNSTEVVVKESAANETKPTVSIEIKNTSITHVVFKKYCNGECTKSVTCPKNLKYSIELEGKSVEFLGAPKFIQSLEDLKVLLQIVNETELNSLYVLH
ncbi:uncharacterized protein LOC126372964 [Pectinophora gossypiella]|uniref:Uncharacterized protein n=1 Tax=Pectinophora gossypiella TaxID=13191 RepID=A0A1E1WML2_PECGO|nr:uncharacterized protein LOC126372964 [Pectinophora gossypiella]